MATWTSRGLRGSMLEELINLSNEKYKENGLALVQKIPTPIKPVQIDKESRHITLAYFDQKSTVDYIGVVQGIPICFDVKESTADSYPLRNIHEHQVSYMEEYEKQNGVSFIILMFTHRNQSYYLRLRELQEYIKRASLGGPKHFKYEELDQAYFIPASGAVVLHYLHTLKQDLEERKV